jgi:hypothetical protein
MKGTDTINKDTADNDAENIAKRDAVNVEI